MQASPRIGATRALWRLTSLLVLTLVPRTSTALTLQSLLHVVYPDLEVAVRTTDDQAEGIGDRIRTFSGLSLTYSRSYLSRDRFDPGGPLVAGILYTAATMGLVIYVFSEESGPWERVAKLGVVGLTSGLLTGLSWGAYVTEKREQRSAIERTEALAEEMDAMIADVSSGDS